MAVIKANAYGHGMIEVVSALGDADALAVARLCEAQALRRHGVAQRIVVLTGVQTDDDLQIAMQLGCDLVVHSHEQIELLEARPARDVRVWLKVDTGMHRLGVAAADVPAAVGRLRRCCDDRSLGMMTHLASADDFRSDMTLQQIEALRSVADNFSGDVSVGNSAAILGWQDTLQDLREQRTGFDHWIRPGIALYGVSPFLSGTGADFGLRPVMQFESCLLAVKPVRAGDGVGYGSAWRAREDGVLGLVSAGYGDGYSRYCPSGTPVLVNGRRVALAGRVSMDTCAVDLGPDASERPGDPVVLWGDGLPVEEIAREANTIPYQLLSGVTHREAATIED
jgi:alanine racemase